MCASGELDATTSGRYVSGSSVADTGGSTAVSAWSGRSGLQLFHPSLDPAAAGHSIARSYAKGA
eukprot:CAMPEP_0119404718 /NCGR_PEP_ID=MMETSP1334-20130426/144037_1 /TAXON_ID=127549 /ORGANISM="Calcidiscus leptoporus, Strain RCC1130" /LENGTH=63 /DNA_ID=CAMNT_0007428689 /DNA_START=834 /DNA_END=1025 /DNA_ORIENTATION=-